MLDRVTYSKRIFQVSAERITVSQIAAFLQVSKSFLYSAIAAYPAEVLKSKEDLESWSAFVNRHRIEPIGGRMPSAPRARTVVLIGPPRIDLGSVPEPAGGARSVGYRPILLP